MQVRTETAILISVIFNQKLLDVITTRLRNNPPASSDLLRLKRSESDD